MGSTDSAQSVVKSQILTALRTPSSKVIGDMPELLRLLPHGTDNQLVKQALAELRKETAVIFADAGGVAGRLDWFKDMRLPVPARGANDYFIEDEDRIKDAILCMLARSDTGFLDLDEMIALSPIPAAPRDNWISVMLFLRSEKLLVYENPEYNSSREIVNVYNIRPTESGRAIGERSCHDNDAGFIAL